VNRDRVGAKLGGVSLGDHSFGGETFDPREWSSVGEADIVREEEEKVLVVGVGLEEAGAFFGVVEEMVVGTGLEVAK